MCCFSRPIRHVSGTRIFARRDGERQAIVYAMKISADEDLAMVLPIPTPPGSPEDAVEFVSLEGYERFFDEMESGFPQMEAASDLGEATRSASKLVVHEVGAFDASFVPTQDDFDRLDDRFRIAKEVWAKMPTYADYGFAVFKLRKGERQNVHPMAFWFPMRDASRLFFPTVHIHDGSWTPTAGFDHALYCQVDDGHTVVENIEGPWMPSNDPARSFMNVDATQGLVLPKRYVYKRSVWGDLPNQDVLV